MNEVNERMMDPSDLENQELNALVFRFLFGKNSKFGPEGTKEELTVAAKDGEALFSFENPEYTKKIVKSMTKSRYKSMYLPKSKKVHVKFPGMKKNEIYLKVSKDYKEV